MIETVGTRISKWGEGPVWHDCSLWFVDIEGHQVCSFNPVSGEDNSWDVSERVGFAIPRASGGLIIGGDSGLSFFDPETQTKTPIIDPEPDKKPDNRFNDGKCDPAGRLWAGTISTVKKEGDATLYRLDTEHELTVQYPNVTNSNGLCWTKGNSTMFYIDTPSKKIRRFDFDNTTGTISNESIAVDTVDLEGSPDGMTIDENDHLWVAFCRGSAVRCFDPVSGAVLDTIEIPVTGPTSCAFGGEDLSTLYITSGKFANLDEDGAGALYSCRPGVRGLPSVAYAG